MDISVKSPLGGNPLVQLLKLLGVSSLKQSQVQNSLDLLRLSEQGLSVKAIHSLQNKLQVSNAEMSRLLGLSESTLQRRYRKAGKLSELESQAIIQLAELWTQGVEIFTTESDFREWLFAQNLALGNRTPFSLLHTPLGREHVREIILRIEWGIYS